MEIDEAVKAYLLTKTALTALIGQQIYPDIIPSNATYPCVVYLKVSDAKIHTLTGQLEIERPVFQFSAYSTGKASTRAVTNLIKSALCDYHGTLSGIVVQKIELLNEMSGAELSGDGTQKIYVDDLEYQITFEKE